MQKRNKAILSIATAMVLYNNSFAQDSVSLDTLTVTAQKIEENVQDIPISTTIFDEFDIESKNIKTIKDINAYTPNLFIHDTDGSGISEPSLRGLSSGTGSNYSTSASLFVDGVPINSRLAYNWVIEDIQRIEVLKGPQGTLYGKDTHAGAINIITKQPSNETKAKVSAELGSDDKRVYSFNISGPILQDKLFAGLTFKHYEKDGFIHNSTLNKKVDYREYDYARLNLRYLATDNLELSLISSKNRQKDGSKKMASVNNTSRIVTNNLKEHFHQDSISHALKIKYNINDYTLESLTSILDYETDAVCDTDFSPYTYFEITKMDTVYKKKAQEFRLSKINNTYKLVSGIYFDKDKGPVEVNANIYDSSTNATYYNTPYYRTNEDGESLGLFTHLDYKLNNKLSLIGGIRYDKDKKFFKDALTKENLSNDYGAISPKVALKYNINPNSMIYTTIAKGYKSGGYLSYAPAGYDKKYNKEELWSYEIGSKNMLFDNRLMLNSAIYYMDISDMQVSSSVNTQGNYYISNAAKATSKGLEIEAKYQATNTISLFGSLGYNITKFENYKDTQGDYSGNYNTHAPKYNYNVGAQYRGANNYYAKVDLNGYGKTYLDKSNTNSKDAYSLVNLKIGYEEENYDIYLYADNLFDKKHDTNGEQSGSVILYSEPREIGIQLAYRF